LLRYLRAELQVGTQRLSESVIARQVGLVRGFEVQRDEPVALSSLIFK
jgi:hypothetical protein